MSVLYLCDLQGTWWPGVSRRCTHCQGALIVVADEVTCLSCARTDYTVQERPRPTRRELYEAAIANEPPVKRGRPPGSGRPKSDAHCQNGHLRTDQNTYLNRRGWRVCRACKLESWHRKQMRRDAAVSA